MPTEKVLVIGATGIEEKSIVVDLAVETTANFCDLAMDGQTLVNYLAPYKYIPNVGVAQIFGVGVAPLVSSASPQMGTDGVFNNTSGSGAILLESSTCLMAATGTTATGYARTSRLIGFTAADFGYNFYAPIHSSIATGLKLAARVHHYLSAVSDATDNYTARVTLIGEGPTTNSAPAATNTGITLSYNHAVNSGNYVITYRNSSGVLATINTSVAPGIALGNGKDIIVKAEKTGPATSSISVDVGGTVYTITDSALNAGSSWFKTAVGIQIVKTAGTVSCDSQVRDVCVARNLL